MEDEQLTIFSIELTALVGHDVNYHHFEAEIIGQRDKFSCLSE